MKGYESYHYGQVKPDENDIKDHPLITTLLVCISCLFLRGQMFKGPLKWSLKLSFSDLLTS